MSSNGSHGGWPSPSPAKQHAASLTTWLNEGAGNVLAQCHSFIERGVPCRSEFVATEAAMLMLTRQWRQPELAADLLRRYVASGIVTLDQRMDVLIPGSVHWAKNGWQVLEVSARERHVPATLVLLELGALEATDFSAISPDLVPLGVGDGALAASLDKFARRMWPSSPEVHAQFTEVLMRRRIEGAHDLAEQRTPAALAEPIRRRRAL